MPSRLDATTVVLTRAREDNAGLASELRDLGAEVIELPCVRTEPLADATALRAAIAGLGPSDLLVLTSRAGADAVANATPARAIRCPIAAVGRATADRARSLGVRVAFVASRADGRTLARELPLSGGEVVLARSDLADGELPAILRSRGARVREVTAYRTVARLDGDAGVVRDAIERGSVTVVVASPSAVDALTGAIGPVTLRRATFVAIGPRTAARVLDIVGVVALVAETTDVQDLVRAIPVAIPVGGLRGARPPLTLR